MRDVFQRPLKSLRLSVTDRCNLRCSYCMPEENYTWLPGGHILSFEEIASLVDRFLAVGVTRLRLTGGEPLLRKEVHALVKQLVGKPGLEDLAMTTNGVLLETWAGALRDAGLHRLTVSLDTLKADVFKQLSRRDSLEAVLRGIRAAVDVGFGEGLKLDTVVIRGTNEGEVFDLLAYAQELGAELRFIEYMDVGGATRWDPKAVVSRGELLARLSERLGQVEPIVEHSSAPAERFRLPGGQTFGIIASTTQPFCSACDRARLTADGHLFTCLYATQGLDLKTPLRAGASTEQLETLLRETWSLRRDRGAEQRLELERLRGPLRTAAELKQSPHLEMHTRGG